MLERFSSQIQSIVLTLVVGVLVVVFASQFGGAQSQGCTADARAAVTVAGESFTTSAYQAVLMLGYPRQTPEQLSAGSARRDAANGIAERVLLAEEAKKLGIVIEPDDALREVVRRNEVYLTLSVDAPAYARRSPLPAGFRKPDGTVDRDQLEGFIESLRRTPADFATWQAQELMAERMRDVVRQSVTVAPGEVWDAFVAEQDKATFRYVRFRPAYYSARLDPTTAELDAFIASHAQAVNDEYAANRTQYTGLAEQVRSRHILIEVAEDADEPTKAAARARATALLATARAADSRGFAALARLHSQDDESGPKGGDLGWNARGRMVAAFDEAQFTLPVGGTSDVIATQFGFHIIRVEGKRSGDIPELDAKREIAERLYRTEEGRAAAERAANEMLARLRAGTSIDDLATELSPPPVEGAPTAPVDPNGPTVETATDVGPGEAPSYGWNEGTPVTQAAYALANDGDVGAAPVRVGDEFVIFRLDTRQRANRDDFTAETQARLRSMLRSSKQDEAVVTYTRALRERAERAGRISIDPAVLNPPSATPAGSTSEG